jgi:hypothetical protein
MRNSKRTFSRLPSINWRIASSVAFGRPLG